MRILPVAAALVLALVSPAFAAGKLPVKIATIQSSTKTYEIKVQYPQTGNAAIDGAIAQWAKKQASDFRAEAASDGTAELPYSLDIQPDVKRNDDKMFAVMFTVDAFEGGAHGNISLEAVNFLMPSGWRVYLPEIFTPAGLKKISALARVDLDKRLSGPDGMSEQDWRNQGAGPDWNNFAAFVLLPRNLYIEYPPYQVAAYAAGPQESELPLTPLQPFYRADWRAPAASFDCAAARTSVEHAICSDVALARLDRQASTAYATAVTDESDAAAKDALRAAQRAWLKQRDAACSGQSAKGQIGCLTRLYKEKLAQPAQTP